MIKPACFVAYSSLWLDSYCIFLFLLKNDKTALLTLRCEEQRLTIDTAASPQCYISWSCCMNCVRVLKDVTSHKHHEWRFLKLFHPSVAKHPPFSETLQGTICTSHWRWKSGVSAPSLFSFFFPSQPLVFDWQRSFYQALAVPLIQIEGRVHGEMARLTCLQSTLQNNQ